MCIELVVVPYLNNESKTEGDSAITIETTIPYEDGMTVSDLHEKTLKVIGGDWGFDVDSMPLNELAAEVFGSHNGVVGGFVIKKSLHEKVLRSSSDVSNDSDVYNMVYTMKCMIQELSEKEIVE